MHKSLIIVILFSVYSNAFCQLKSTLNPIDFLVDKIKHNYAGYKDKVASEKQFDLFIDHLKSGPVDDTFKVLSKIALYFNDMHLVMFDKLAAHAVDSVACKSVHASVVAYLQANTGQQKNYEGFWINDLDNCIIGIKKTSEHPLTYKGYVIENRTKAIPGYTVLTLTQSLKNNFLADYAQERMRFRFFLNSSFKGDSLLQLYPYGKWRKLKKYSPGILQHTLPFSYSNMLKVIDSNTIVLKLPSFGSNDVKIIDSIIATNEKLISQTKNLIVDIRNNSGGTVRGYLPLLPYIYTNPIVHCGGAQLCSDDLANDLKEEIAGDYRSGDTVAAKKNELFLEQVLLNKGKLLPFTGDTLLKDQPIKNYPRNVAVITNNRCLSAAELLVLNFKQSKKVTTFGENTGGAVDYLDAMMVDFFQKPYFLFIAATKREITASQPVYDGIGIKPDVEIFEKADNWIKVITNYYEKN